MQFQSFKRFLNTSQDLVEEESYEATGEVQRGELESAQPGGSSPLTPA